MLICRGKIARPTLAEFTPPSSGLLPEFTPLHVALLVEFTISLKQPSATVGYPDLLIQWSRDPAGAHSLSYSRVFRCRPVFLGGITGSCGHQAGKSDG